MTGSFSILLFLFSENCAENQPHQRAAIKHLIQNCHRKIHTPGLYPCWEILCILKKNRCDQAHYRAHDAANTNGNCVCNKLRTIIWSPDLTQRQATGVPLTEFQCLRTSQGLWQTHLFRSNKTREQAVLRPHLCRFDGTESSHSRSLGHKISQMDTKSNTRGYEIKRYEYRNS